MYTLGRKARDKITGFEGILTAHVTYLYGCNQYGISPKANEGKVGDTCYFDEGRIEIIGDGVAPADVAGTKPGGDQRDAPMHIIR
jgi:hypothetical protein